jgi:hypothetical protein
MAANASKELDYILAICIRDLSPSPDKALIWQEFSRLVLGNRIVSYVISKSPEGFPDPSVNRLLQETHRSHTLSSLRLAAEILKINRLASDRKIPIYFYKGQVWSQWIYNDLKMRPPGDIDVFVPSNYLFPLIEALIQTEGYTIHPYHKHLLSGPKESRAAFLKSDYHIPLEKIDESGKTLSVVELHWEIAYPRLCFDFSPNDFPSRGAVLDFAGSQVPVVTNEFQFLLLIVNHGGKENWKQLRYLVDLKAFIDKFGDTLDWDSVQQMAKEKGISKLLSNSLGLLKGAGYPWRSSLPEVREVPQIQKYFNQWKQLPPEPSNMSWRYFWHSITTRDRSRTASIFISHLRFLTDFRLHRQKLKWYKRHRHPVNS